jgi:hypothetical protein
MFAFVGLQTNEGDAKPALETWDGLRSGDGVP